MTYTDNKDRKVYNIDLDHTLTADKPGTYSEDPEPEYNMIKAVTRLYMAGHIIIIWTARMWGDAPWLVSWLIKNRVPFHGVFMGKGGSDVYLDDKAINPKEFLESWTNPESKK